MTLIQSWNPVLDRANETAPSLHWFTLPLIHPKNAKIWAAIAAPPKLVYNIDMYNIDYIWWDKYGYIKF